MARKKMDGKTSGPAKVEGIKHKDKRKKIPTEELRDFVAEEENAPKAMLYPRDPSLDPQLVWKGKDEQDREDLAVPVVPIYIEEKIRLSSTGDIACWFIETNYNSESFFVRHAYFTGAEEPYEKLKRALRAEIDEATWSELYSTTSRPFDPPETGKIAIKVINHYGDEVLKVYEVKAAK
jgi:hypothetical protein